MRGFKKQRSFADNEKITATWSDLPKYTFPHRLSWLHKIQSTSASQRHISLTVSVRLEGILE